MSTEKLAISIVRKLVENGFVAYFAGGWVRDYLLGNGSSDIDIATNATPEQITSLFPKTILVGAAFGVVIVVWGGKNFEVSTFRKDLDYIDGRHPVGISFTSAQEDALRRDFTINGLFFDPLEEHLIDYVNGQEDLKAGIIRTIGKPFDRFKEDRLRMIRAVRFAKRFHFKIETHTKQAIKEFAHTLLPSVSIERVWQELTKMAKFSSFREALNDLLELNLLQTIFPELSHLNSSKLNQLTLSFENFPANCPTILYIQELFPDYSLAKKLELCRYLKTTSIDSKIVEFFHHSLQFFKKNEHDSYEWAHFYAHPYAELFLEVQSAKLSVLMRPSFLHEHEMRQMTLFSHILRIQQKKPLVTSRHLVEIGVSPGKKMGELLNEAERIAINQNLENSDTIISHLKTHL